MIKKRRFADGGNISSTPMPIPPNPPQAIGGSGVSPSGVNIQPTPQPASPQPAYPPPPVPGGNMFKKGGKIKSKGKMTKMAKGGGLAAKKAMALAALSMAARRGAGSVPPPRPSMGTSMGAGSPPPGLGGPPPGMKKGGKMKKFAKGGKTAMKKFAKGGSIDGIAERGKTKAKGANIGPVVGKKKGGMC